MTMNFNQMSRCLRQWHPVCIALAGMLTITACSDDDGPRLDPDQPGEQVEFANDLLNGRLVYVAGYNDSEGFKVPIKANQPVNISICGESPFTIDRMSDNDGDYVVGSCREGLPEDVNVVVMRAENAIDPKDFRHFIVIVVDGDLGRKAESRSPSSNMTKSYGDFIGMGTQCFEMLGNTKRAVLQSSLIPIEDQNMVTSQVLDITEMFEVSGETFQSTMNSWAFNVGLSFKGLGKAGKENWGKMSGCINFGINKTTSTSDDFEYYMNVYKVVRGEIAYNMKEFEKMATGRKANQAATFLSYVSDGFISDIYEVENKNLVTDDFFTVWGTDMISQAQLGGFKIYMYGRETNTYETSVGVDASIELKGTKTQTPTERQWYDIYMAKNSPYLGGNISFSYQNDDYFQASKSTKYSLAVGGNPSLGDDPDRWINGFEVVDDNVKWQPISYRRHSDSAAPGSEEVWNLYPIEDMGTNVANAVESIFTGVELSHQDSLILSNARANILSIQNAKKDYVDRHLTAPKEATRLVLCDVMMKYDSDKQKSGKPEPFVAKDPRDASKLRTYYPMMANKFFDYRRSSEHQRGHAIDTNVDCFIVGAETGSHYWYYALAHEDDCTGIVDIHFYDHLEDYFVYRGDEASKGSGLLNYPKKVCVKYFDKGVHSSDQKITAFGIYDDHKEVNNIIASTGGSELAIEATESEYNKWVEFWSGAKDHHEWPKYAFYHGGGSIPHGIYVKYTTKNLPITSIKNVKHPDKY